MALTDTTPSFWQHRLQVPLMALLAGIGLSALTAVVGIGLYLYEGHRFSGYKLRAQEIGHKSDQLEQFAEQLLAESVRDAKVELRSRSADFARMLADFQQTLHRDDIISQARLTPALAQLNAHWQVVQPMIQALVRSAQEDHKLDRILEGVSDQVQALIQFAGDEILLDLSPEDAQALRKLFALQAQLTHWQSALTLQPSLLLQSVEAYTQAAKALQPDGSTRLRMIDLGQTLGQYYAQLERVLATRHAQFQSTQIIRELAELRAQAMQLPGLLSELERRALWTLRVGALGVVALVALVLLFGALLWRRARREVARSNRQINRNERAILRLLDEISALADGDLTVQASVTEDITGAVADSVNFAIESLRSLVQTIRVSAAELSVAVERGQETASNLLAASDVQSRETQSAAQSSRALGTFIRAVAETAQASAQTAHEVVRASARGSESIRRSIQGMRDGSAQTQDAARRLKRLGESAQEVGEMVEMIDDIAERTHILALNASIRSGHLNAGQSYSGVTDEVQALAERVSTVARQISALIERVRIDTQEAMAAVESSMVSAQAGVRLADSAAKVLASVDSDCRCIAADLDAKAQQSNAQVEAAEQVLAVIELLQSASERTHEGAQETAAAVARLQDLGAALRASIKPFLLPRELPESLLHHTDDPDFDRTVVLKVDRDA